MFNEGLTTLMAIEAEIMLDMFLERANTLSKLSPDQRIEQEKVYALQDIGRSISRLNSRMI